MSSSGGDTGGSAGPMDRQTLLDEVDRILHANRLEITRCIDRFLNGQQDVPTLQSPPRLPGSVPHFPSSPSSLLAGQQQAWSSGPLRTETLDVKANGSDSMTPLVPVEPAEKNASGKPVVRMVTDDAEEAPADSAVKKKATEQKKVEKKKSRHTRVSSLMSQAKRTELMAEASPLERLTRHRYYEWFSGGLIVVNSIFMGVQTQSMALRANDEAQRNVELSTSTPWAFLGMQAAFGILFAIDLALRWMCDGVFEFFRTEDRSWNILDVVCVSIGAIDTTTEIIITAQGDSSGTPLSTFSVLRVLRVARIVRVVRVIRVMKFFRELRMMIFSIIGCLKSVTWIILVLGLVFYLFGLTFTQAVNDSLSTLNLRTAEEYQDTVAFFGTLDKSILSLYMAMSGGNDWGQYFEALEVMPSGGIQALLFILFITFSIFAVVNIVTGVFVDNAMQSGRQDREVIVHEELENKKEYLRSLQALFDRIDDEGDGTITPETLRLALMDDNVQAFFTAMKLDVPDARILFELLDFDESGEITIDEFLNGCYRLQGDASNIDNKIMQAEMKFLLDKVSHLTEIVQTASSKPPPKMMLAR